VALSWWLPVVLLALTGIASERESVSLNGRMRHDAGGKLALLTPRRLQVTGVASVASKWRGPGSALA